MTGTPPRPPTHTQDKKGRGGRAGRDRGSPEDSLRPHNKCGRLAPAARSNGVRQAYPSAWELRATWGQLPELEAPGPSLSRQVRDPWRRELSRGGAVACISHPRKATPGSVQNSDERQRIAVSVVRLR